MIIIINSVSIKSWCWYSHSGDVHDRIAFLGHGEWIHIKMFSFQWYSFKE